jgi:hypothetical protein
LDQNLNFHIPNDWCPWMFITFFDRADSSIFQLKLAPDAKVSRRMQRPWQTGFTFAVFFPSPILL